ncbi:MAG: hypothetical protein MN733_41745, partial [Nitrososphaera sp.]|nr:hypothetical protein [Nitrososphaera sp.]
MKKSIIIAGIVAAIAIPASIYAASPLFVNTTVDEPLPVAGTENEMMEKDESTEMEDKDEMAGD